VNQNKMAEEKTKGQKKYEEVMEYLTGKKVISSPFDKKAKDLTKALLAKSPQEAAAELAKAFYKAVGQDTSMYKKQEEILGLLSMQLGADEQGRSVYGQIIAALSTEKPDVEAVYDQIKKAHKDNYTSNVVQIKTGEIDQLSGDDKADVANAIRKELPALKDQKDMEIAPKLTQYMTMIAERKRQDEAMQHAKTGEKYAQGLQDKFREKKEAEGDKKATESLDQKLQEAA
jgi:hypothetical protein